MLSKSKIKWINSLSDKKNRDEENVFVAEGVKLVSELLFAMKCRLLIYTDENLIPIHSQTKLIEKEVVSIDDLKKISSHKTPQGIIGVFEKPAYDIHFPSLRNQLSIALDDIQDPGNLGTIIRLADWFGIKDVFCSLHTADVYNPKTIQATMGAIARVRVHYVNLADFLRNVTSPQPSQKESEISKTQKLQIYGTFMDGENIYEKDLSENGIIIMGNEGNGISEKILPFISQKLFIPTFPLNANTSESLNVGIATAITVAEFRRRSKS